MHAPPNHDSVESNSLAVENRKPSTAQNASSGGDSNGVTLPALESTRSAAAQEIAAQALHLSPEREVVSPRLEQNATSLQTVSSPQTSHITTSIVAKPNGTPEDPVTSEQLSHTTRRLGPLVPGKILSGGLAIFRTFLGLILARSDTAAMLWTQKS